MPPRLGNECPDGPLRGIGRGGAGESPVVLHRLPARRRAERRDRSQQALRIGRRQPRRHGLQRIAERLAKRLAFLRCARLPALLTAQELQLLDAVIAEQARLPTTFVSRRLLHLLKEHQDQLLALYPKPEKMARRLSRGMRWYAALGYLNRA